MSKIVTVCNFPPIPDRRIDWCSYYEGDEESGRYGYGRTEAEAIADFIENYADDEAQAYHPDDVRAVMDANRPRLFGIVSAVKAAMEKNNVR